MGVGPAVVFSLIALMQGVSCQTWGVTMPPSITGISGSCLTIPCRFEIPKNEKPNLVNCSKGGMWKKGSVTGPNVFSALKPSSNIIQGELVGDITEKNCTTTLHSFPKNYSDVYFFRMECQELLKFTFDKPLNIILKPELPPPELTSVGQMSEGSTVSLQCSVPVPCSVLPPSITWLPRDSSRQEQTLMQQGKDGLTIMKSTLTFIASADHHNRSVACSVSYPLTRGGSSLPSATTHRLNVLYAPRVPVATLSTSVPVSEGRVVTFTCFSEANPPVSLYTWYRVHSGKLTKRGEGEMLVLQVSHNDSGAYVCEAQSQRGSRRSRYLSLEVIDPAGSHDGVVLYIICGVLLVLLIITVVVDVYKYQNLSRRLKLELKGDHTYSDLRSCSVTSDYDKLQARQPKSKPIDAHVDPTYENRMDLQTS
ncbi:myelin-associated glycoprotein isoform X2 [Centropristis striata]|uniref:myelin-associated glycoprotein isoform X2 n=1 Tax=Centropristis striata TaxID=184440 RepID=UPI0027E0CC9C|nr:myelin-associated glycoprotein isoform X2 [Centropristis striata]